MNILVQLTTDLSKRQVALRADRNKLTFYMKEYVADDLIQIAYTHLLRGLERSSTLVDIATTVGRRIRQIHRLKQDSVLDAHAGWFVLISFIECKIIKYFMKYTYRNGKKAKHKSYHFMPLDWKAIKELWTLIDKTKVDMSPLREPASDWVGAVHSTGNTVIKKMSPSAESRMSTDPEWIGYRVLNKLQQQPWAINKEVFGVFQQCMRVEIPLASLESDSIQTIPSPFKYAKEVDPQKRKSLEMEVEAIEQIALANINNVFYHVYNYDFRGRIYVNTAYLHEQSSDNAKGLLLFGKGIPLGDRGYYWMKIHTSNCFGNDKVELEDRSQFVEDRMAEFIGFADNPMQNTGWMDTDKPFMFLACCYELRRLQDWVSADLDYRCFESALPLYIDGSNNGVQHLAALSLDETVAPLVNLVPQQLPGDVYRYIAGYAWEKLGELAAKLTPDEVRGFDAVFEKCKELQSNYSKAPANSEEKAAAYAAAKEWRNANHDLRVKMFPVYWLKINSPKDQRKIVKRNVMTLGYGGTPYGMGQQIIDDTRDMSAYLRDKEHLWGALLGNLVYETCYEKLPGPAMMLRLFQALALLANQNDRDLCWTTPVTGFPVAQSYRKPGSKRAKLTYGEDELKIQINAWEDAALDKGAQETGSAPNIVHSFDAAHLNMTVAACDYMVSVVHDSFGCHPGNMQDLFYTVREQFLLFYAHDPLQMILKENDAMHLMPERGNLNLDLILQSDYAFV